jgi:HAD superfamily hydrolase (TIGR01509 family)
VRAVLIDVGGTLWPNVWPERDDDRRERISRLRTAVPALGIAEAEALVDAVSGPTATTERQPTEDIIVSAIRAVKPETAVPTDAFVNAMYLPADGRVEAFDGARDLLRGLHDNGVRVVIVSNVMWRKAVSHRRDFDALRLSEYVAGYVTSLDVGWRKPHDRFFRAALALAGEQPESCAMVGDSETNDIEPARARGMFTIRVAIEEPRPTHTVAHYLCGSLREVTEILLAERT